MDNTALDVAGIALSLAKLLQQSYDASVNRKNPLSQLLTRRSVSEHLPYTVSRAHSCVSVSDSPKKPPYPVFELG